MKKITFTISFLFLALFSYSQCNYTLEMNDSYSDGWGTGNSIDLTVGGVTTNYTLSSGSSSSVEFEVTTGDDITTVFNCGGSYCGEASFRILDSSGNVLVSNAGAGSGSMDAGPADVTTGTITANCPSCVAPTALSAASITTTSADISWTSDDSSFNIEVVDITAGGTATGTATYSDVTSPYSLSGLAPNTEYEVYVQADCTGGDTSDWVGPMSFTTDCSDVSTYPYLESFETITSGQPDCWSVEGTTTSSSYHFSSYQTGSSGRGMRFNSYFNSIGNTSELITPTFDVSSLTALQLSFYYKNPTGGNFEILVSSNDGDTYTSIATDLTSQADWTEATYDLSSYISSSIILKFKGTSNWGSGDAYIYLDEVSLSEPSSDTMDWNNLQWVQPTADANSGSTTSVTVETGTQISAYAQGFKAGLTDTTTGSAAAGVECWIGIHNEDTDPSTWPSSAWNIATFDSEQGNNDEYLLTTTNAPIGTNYVASRWRVNNGLYTYGGWNGPWDGVTKTSVELVVTPIAGDTFATATDLPFTISPEGTGCSSTPHSINFQTDGYTDSGMDSSCLNTNTGVDGFFNWTATSDGLTFNSNAGVGNPGLAVRDSSGNEIDCSGTFAMDEVLTGWAVGDELVLQFFDYGTTLVDVTFCLELFTLPLAPNCAENLAPTGTDVPFNNGAVTISWDAPTAGPAPTDYEVFWGTESGNLTSIGLVGDPTMTSVNITGLEYGGTYYFSVVPQNGGTLASGCAEASFTVENASIPFNCDFAFFPSGFSVSIGTLITGPDSSTSTSYDYWYDDGFNDGTSSGAAKINLYLGTNAWLVSPQFDLSGGIYYLNLDALATEFTSSSSSSLDAIFGDDDFATLMTSADGGSTWTELYRWDSTNNPGADGEGMPEITLSGYSSSTRFAVYGESANSAQDIYFFVDNFQITSTSLGIEENNISLFNYFPNPVNDVLTIKAQKDVDNVTVYNMLGQVVKRQTPNTRDCTVDLSAMQAGAYFVQVSVENSVETVRILKN